MGYRSDVRFSTTKEGLAFLRGELDRLNRERGLDHPLVGTGKDGKERDFDCLAEAGGGVLFGFDGVKWHGPAWPEVAAFEAAMRSLDEAGFPWTSARTGEDPEDCETDCGNGAYDVDIPHLCVQTSIGYW